MNWPYYPISLVAERFISGGTPNTKIDEYWQGDIPWITGADFNNGEVLLGRRYINKAAVENSATNIVPKGSILMVTRTGVGKIAIAPADIAISQDITGVILKQAVSTSYVMAAIRNRMSVILAAQRGATIKGVTRKDVENLRVPLPPPSEQRRIVEILDQADRLRKLRAHADAKARRIMPALFIKMFGDPATNPLGWEIGKLGNVIDDTQYGTSKKANTNEEGIPVLRMNNISYDGYLDLTNLKHIELSEKDLQKYALVDGDILFNRTNSKELVGKTGLWRSKDTAVLASYLIRVRIDSNEATPEFIWAYMNSPFIKQILLNKSRRAIGMANINARELRDLPLILPGIQQQKLFAEEIYQVNEYRKKRMECNAGLNKLFDTLLHRAFTGYLTAKWREAHMKELLQEMEMQAKALA